MDLPPPKKSSSLPPPAKPAFALPVPVKKSPPLPAPASSALPSLKKTSLPAAAVSAPRSPSAAKKSGGWMIYAIIALLLAAGGFAFYKMNYDYGGNADDWQLGDSVALTVAPEDVRRDASFIDKVLDGARKKNVASFFSEHGYDVTAVDLVKIEKTADGAQTNTYALTVSNRQILYYAPEVPLSADSVDMNYLVGEVELERGAARGCVWNTASRVTASGRGEAAGTLLWRWRKDGKTGVVTVERCHKRGIASEEQLAAAARRYDDYRKVLDAALAEMRRQVDALRAEKIAKLPPKPVFSGVKSGTDVPTGAAVLGAGVGGAVGGYEASGIGVAVGKGIDMFSNLINQGRRKKEQEEHNRRVAAHNKQLETYNKLYAAADREVREFGQKLLDEYKARINAAKNGHAKPVPPYAS